MPHTITHQRIYIVPSKRGCAFLITLLIMLVASINYSLSLGYALSFVLTGLFAATLLHTHRNLAGIGIDFIKPNNTFAGQAVTFHVTLRNIHARQRYGIRIIADKRHRTMVHIAPQSEATANLSIDDATRGICQLGRITIESDWPLGLWTSWSYFHVSKQALVYPKPEDQPPPLPNQQGNDEGIKSQFTHSGDVAGLRDYQPGDSMGSIAWKSAARGLGLKSRTYDAQEARATTVLDLKLAGAHGIEARLSRLCAWALAAEQSQIDYAVHLEDFTLGKDHGTKHKRQTLEALALYGIRTEQSP